MMHLTYVLAYNDYIIGINTVIGSVISSIFTDFFGHIVAACLYFTNSSNYIAKGVAVWCCTLSINGIIYRINTSLEIYL